MDILQPSPHLVQKILSIAHNNLSYPIEFNTAEAVIACTLAWLQTPEGRNTLASLLKIEVVPTDANYVYVVDDHSFSPAEVVTLMGYIIQGHPIEKSRVDKERIHAESCDFCSSKVICARDVFIDVDDVMRCCHSCSSRETLSPRRIGNLEQSIRFDCKTCGYELCIHSPRHEMNQELPF